jgi:energy-coupling factor transport system ATP-binding protein
MNIAIRDLSFIYPNGLNALTDITLEIGGGERVALIGQNGSGKTTLAKHLIGLLRPSNGHVRIGNWDTRTHSAAQMARRVGFLFQNSDNQIFKSSVTDEIAYGPRQLALTPPERQARIASALERTGLAAERDAHPYELHPAKRKWVALASVLAMDTEILVLDEPTPGQDARGTERLGALIASLAREGKTVLTITHDLDFVAENFERVVALGQGRLLRDGSAHSVLGDADLLAQTSVLPPQITRLGAALELPKTTITIDEFIGLRYHSILTRCS